MSKRVTMARGGSIVPLYAVFALTGFGTALLGATLPALLPAWRLTDESAGVLFLVLFVASSVGSLVQRSHSLRTVAAGVSACAAGSALLALAHGHSVFICAALFGFGLGVCISTVTRVRLRCDVSQRTRELNRLNLIWGLGAFACPALANAVLRRSTVRTLFMAVAAVCVVLLVGTLHAAREFKSLKTYTSTEESKASLPLPAVAAWGAFLAVGMESALGGWLATYTHRLETSTVAPIEATTLFWLGLLASRGLFSLRAAQRFSHGDLFKVLTVLVAVGSVLLLSSARPGVVLFCAALLGFGVGPIFPMLLADVLPGVRGNLIFVIGGCGSAALPWLTGALSQHFQSLRAGLAAPVCSGVLLLLLAPELAKLRTRLGATTPARSGG